MILDNLEEREVATLEEGHAKDMEESNPCEYTWYSIAVACKVCDKRLLAMLTFGILTCISCAIRVHIFVISKILALMEQLMIFFF